MDNGQKTPHGHPDFNSYVKILRDFIFGTDKQTDYMRGTALNISSSPYSNLFSIEYATSKKGCVTLLPEQTDRTLKQLFCAHHNNL